ncbi:MAG TPA: iron-sulfur cluster assembly accessory protein [Oligoflexia bacterium]|nr:iron-sulfur cluster assembly accessory protein [Oligoflexia bacterium]HMP27107.1 iron-sulfur cluster assembly accessory protein [Oligoflexia bacterium]
MGTTSAANSSGQANFTPTEEQPIFFTPAAIEAIEKAVKEDGEEGEGLRVSVVGGGCSGYQYNLDFEKEERIGDLVLACGSVNVYLDSVSAGYLKGTVIDYVSGLNESGFKFNNPNAKRTCGCGSSFS